MNKMTVATMRECEPFRSAQIPHHHQKTTSKRRRGCLALRNSASTTTTTTTFSAPSIPEPLTATPNCVILGGTGRVGASTAAALLKAIPGASISLASRTQSSYQATLSRRPELRSASHRSVNVNDPSSVLAALKGADLVIHCAGPFQRREDCAVLEASIAAGVPYLDVCDDTEYSQRAKKLHSKAQAAGVPAITTGGIYPGVSNVMAAHMISMARKEYNENFEYVDTVPPTEETSQPTRVLYSYYTAGSGGAGPTILNTTFLLAGEDVVAYKDGQAMTLPPVSNRRVVDFGPETGRKGVWLYSLPEVASGHQVFGVPSISARFGTEPDVWNWGMWLMARLLPKSALSDPKVVNTLVKLVDPLVRAVDSAVGEKVAMLVEVEFNDGKIAAGLFVHEYLSQSVGISTAAFARSMLAGGTSPGVWFPEEQGALSDRRALLQMASEGTSQFILNKPLWEIESERVQLGFGMYW